MGLLATVKIVILSPPCGQRLDPQNAAEMLVEAHSTVNSLVTLALPSTAALKAAIDHIGHPAQAEFAPGLLVCGTLRLHA